MLRGEWGGFGACGGSAHSHNERKVKISPYTYVYYMPTRTISISEEAYEALKSLKESGRMSFSEVIVKYYPRRRALSEVLKTITPKEDLAASIESASKEMRSRKIRKAEI